MKYTEMYYTMKMIAFFSMIAVIVVCWTFSLICAIRRKKQEKKDREIRERREHGKK